MYNPRQGGDPEVVIRQAMRAMAGGRRDEIGRQGGQAGGRRPIGRFWSRLSTAQILLIAAIIGVLGGMAAAFVVLLR